jgi:hypothetical protein
MMCGVLLFVYVGRCRGVRRGIVIISSWLSLSSGQRRVLLSRCVCVDDDGWMRVTWLRVVAWRVGLQQAEACRRKFVWGTWRRVLLCLGGGTLGALLVAAAGAGGADDNHASALAAVFVSRHGGGGGGGDGG